MGNGGPDVIASWAVPIKIQKAHIVSIKTTAEVTTIFQCFCKYSYKLLFHKTFTSHT